jgi:hypothetical protein
MESASQFLRARLEPVARRRRHWRLARSLALWWAVVAAIALGVFCIERFTPWRAAWVLPAIGLTAIGGAGLLWMRSHRRLPNYREIARQIETQHPELHALLLTAVEQQPDAKTGKLNFLQERLIQQAITESTHASWEDTVSESQVLGMQLAQVAACVVLLVVLWGLRGSPAARVLAVVKPTRLEVTPGDTSLERGNGLAVLARFEGPLPAEVAMVVRPDSRPEQRVMLAKSLNDPVFGGTIPEVTNALTYQVVYPNGQSREFKVDVFEYPRLERADAHVKYPDYTGMPEKRVQDTRRVSALEGSTLDYSFQLNKPVALAQLIAKDKSVVPLVVQTNQANAALLQFPLKHSDAYELVLVDTAGRSNKVPTQILVEVLTNRAPELKFAFPRGDQRVSPIEEITFQGEAWDDFGLKGYGITYSLAGANPETIRLGETVPGREKRQFAHVVSLENLQAQPDQLLSYFLWADDVGPDGQIRRTASDMYYAEVRPFEEIFREGQSRSRNESEQDQQEGQGNDALKLADLQKQIINATWRLQRDSGIGLNAPDSKGATQRPKPSQNYAKDINVVEQSQKEALKQAGQKKEQASSPQGKALWEAVEKEMRKATDQLGKAGSTPEPLPSALTSEQAAYQALLKLASHEYQVAQGRRGQSGNNNQRNQRQLDQLDLKQSENRYENQRQAAAKQNPAEREQLQALNRLKELAQRQQDVNERLKELQTALQEAKTEQEKEDIRRQLKRLREEEQQMLADVDELLQRMDRPENQSRMSDARQQLEQTRNQIQRTAESIDKDAVGQALSSGTRAERQLQDLRDDMRKKNSAQFAEEMRQMRSDARDMAQHEDKISDELKGLADPKRKTLSDDGQTKKLLDQLAQQSQKMTNLMDQMSRVSQDAETSEPLLSKQLYDTLRKASQGNIDQSLQRSGDLLKLSFFDQAGQFEQRAHKEIDQVKEGVERAAESVLGDETEALRLARKELDDLSRQLEKEMNQASENPPGTRNQNQNGQQGNSAKGSQQQLAQADQNGQSGGTADQQAQARQGQQGSSAQAGNQYAQQNQPGGQRQSRRGQGQQGQGQQDSQTAQQGQGQNGQQGRQNAQQPGQTPDQNGNAQQASNQPGAQPGNGQQGGQRAQAQANANGGGQQQAQATPQDGQRNQPGARGGRGRQRATLTGQPQGQQATASSDAPGGIRNGRADAGGEGGGDNTQDAPITGEGYADWSDRLRDVEELLDMPDLRGEVAQVRERARALRSEFKKHAKPPQWDVVQTQLAAPLMDVRNRLGEELARRESKDSLVPIDRDPVPQKYSELVRRYYEKLGGGEQQLQTQGGSNKTSATRDAR